MAKYQVIISRRALKFLDKLNNGFRLRIIDDLECLENFPFFAKPLDIAKLRGREGYYRLREGNVRVIFKVNKKSKRVLIEKVAYREEVYE